MTKKQKKILSIAIAAMLLLVTTAVLAGPYDVQVADRTGFAEVTLNDGAIVAYIGDQHTTYGSAGTGTFNSFVRLQGKKTTPERGYNTDGSREFDTKGGKWTHSILLSEIPTIEVGGQLYWEFWADINDGDSGDMPLITLDDFELYTTTNPSLTGYDGINFGGEAIMIYDYDTANSGFILIRDVNQGSGRGDLRYLVPQNGFNPGSCNYGNPACTTFLVLYSEWGGKAGYEFDGGFEEWKVRKYPILQVSKTISGEFDTPVSWTITKDFDFTYDKFIGDTWDHDYIVSVDPIFGDPEHTRVFGTITIVGDDKETVDAEIMDRFQGTPATITGCSVEPVDGKYPIAAKSTVTCTYQLALGAPVDGSNLARATFEVNGTKLAYQGSAGIIAANYVETLTGDPDIIVDDDNLEGEDWTASAASAYWEYLLPFACSADPADYTDGFYTYTHTNTATIIETEQDDDAEVIVNCYAPVLSKDADGSYDERHEWDIEKSVDPTSQSGFAGDYLDWTWTVDVSETFEEENFKVEGEIDVENPTGSPGDMTVSLVDQLNEGTFATVDCDGFGATSITVSPGNTGTCDYTAAPSGRTATLNTATGTFLGIDFVATADVSFVVTVLNGTAVVDDDQESAFPLTLNAGAGPWQWSEPKNHTCSTDPEAYTDGSYSATPYNYATVTGSDGDFDDDDAETTYTCYIWDVSKTSDGFYQDRYDWEIFKTVEPLDQTGGPGDVLSWIWTITWNSFWVEEVNHAVTGVITVTNPADLELTVDVTDKLTGDFAATVDCDGLGGTSLTIAAGSFGTCDYSAAPSEQLAENTATATRNSVSVSDTVPVLWVQGADIGLDAVVSDSNHVDIPVGSSPYSYGDQHTCSSNIASYSGGTYTGYADNTAYITWTGGSDSDSAHTDYTCEAAQVKVLKLTEGLQNPSKVWTFKLYHGSFLLETKSTPPALLEFQTALHLGYTYKLCEVDIPEGWSSTWSDPFAFFESPTVKCVYVTPTLAGEIVSFTVNNEPPMEGCTPGWWRNSGLGAYDQASDPLAQAVAAAVLAKSGNITTGTTDSLFRVAFDLTAEQMIARGLDANLTLLGAVWLGGGDFNALARHGTSALLNSLSVKYEFSASTVLGQVHNAFVSGTLGTLISDYDTASNRDHSACPTE